MKSRTSCFNATVFKKNLTRFAPAWGLYTVYLLISLVMMLSGEVRRFGSNLLDHAQMQNAISAFYALLCAQLLFGDLYNTRMCYSFHALPLRRETWFTTNVLSGFAFHLIPTLSMAVMAALAFVLTGYSGHWAVVPLWLLQVNLQYLCFFGISVLSAFCAGSRFSMAVVWVILNFGSLILGSLVDSIYVSMYYGVKTNMEPFYLFSPYPRMIEEPFMSVQRITVTDSNWGQTMVDSKILLLGENFAYAFIAAAVGLLLIGGALLIYRRRNLECAGDFLAIPALAPVFALAYTLVMAEIFHVLTDSLFTLLGLIVGWFTSQMLLRRTVRVFQKKSFARCGAVVGVFLLSLIITSLDPFGIERWIPETHKVESVSLSEGHYDHADPLVTLEEPEGIEAVIAIHQDCLDYRLKLVDEAVPLNALMKQIVVPDEESVSLTFRYTLTNGRTVNRYYYVRGEENLQYLRKLFSSPEVVFDEVLTEEEFAECNVYATIRETTSNRETSVYGKPDVQSLYRAILADCEAGTMAQSYTWHNNLDRLYRLKFSGGQTIYVYTDCVNTLQWLRDYGLDVDELIWQKSSEYYK